MNKVAIRIKNFRTWGDVGNATRHGRREDPARHVDRERTKLNMHWELSADGQSLTRADEGADIADCLKRLGEARGAKWRKGASVGTEAIWIASADFFEQNGPRGSAGWAEAAQKWARDCLAETAKEFPGQLAAARLDLDEKTPHLSIFLLPLAENAPREARKGSKEAEAAKLLDDPSGASEDALRAAQEVVDKAAARRARRKPRINVSVREHFGSPGKLRALQDFAAAAMQRRGHNLHRGSPKETKGPDHLTPAEGRARIAAAEEQAEQIVAEAQEQAAQIVEEAKAKATKFERAFEAFSQALKELGAPDFVAKVRDRYLEIMNPPSTTSRDSGRSGPGM